MKGSADPSWLQAPSTRQSDGTSWVGSGFPGGGGVAGNPGSWFLVASGWQL